MSKKAIMSRKKALIVGIIILILAFSAIFFKFKTTYQKQYENIPELTAFLEDGTVVKMLPVKVNWTYKGQNTASEIENFHTLDYNFPKENTVYITNKTGKNIIIESNVKYITESVVATTERIKADGFYNGSLTSSDGDFSPAFVDHGYYADYFENEAGEFLYTMDIKYKNQGSVTYAMKIVNYSKYNLDVAKEYSGTSLDEVSKIEELVKKLSCNTYFKDLSVKDKNLNLHYEYYMNEETAKVNMITLFSCIPELQTITYVADNKKVIINATDENPNGEVVEKESKVYTREDLNVAEGINIEKFVKLLESL